MFQFKAYLLSIIFAAVIVCVITKMIPTTSRHKSLIQMMSGIFIILTVVAPLSGIRIHDYISEFEDLSYEAQNEVDSGLDTANNAVRAIIKEQTESYIVEKAAAMGAELKAEVLLDSGDQPYPVSVEISGDASPYVRNQLRKVISNDIGIPEEMQRWT